MDTRRAALVDAFTTEPLAGNAAGVVPDAEGLDESQMQAVARELAVSETAFLLPSGTADRRIRYFTPTQEVDLCGHATVASHAHLAAAGDLDAGTYTLETDVGVLDVEVTDEGRVWMTQNQPTVREVDLDLDRVGAALGIAPSALHEVAEDLPAAVVSTGLPVLVVGVSFLEALGNADPEQAEVERLTDDVDAAGLYAFTFDTLSSSSTLHGRFFAPGVGIAEDPVTGTASGACGAYLRHVEAFDSLPDTMRFEQGHFVDRPGTVHVQVGAEIRVGGHAVTSFDGEIRVPPSDDDEIIEV